MIQVRGIGVCRGGCPLLADVTFDAARGEVLAVIGPNGAGKSTLLGVLAGTIRPTSGRVCIAGRKLDEWRPRQLARMRAVLPQASSLDFPFLVHEVVALGGAPHGKTAGDTPAVTLALTKVGLEEIAERPFPVLSGGERQRVHFARVLTQLDAVSTIEGGVCLLDEPVAALDPRHQHVILGCARELAARGIAVVVVLHDLTLAARYADRLALLHEGRMVSIGSAEAVLQPALLEAAYQIGFTRASDDAGRLTVLANPVPA